MEQYVTNVCKSGFYHLRNISNIRKHLTQQNAETLIHAFISSRLDFCNSLLYSLPKYLIDRIQNVQNAAARIVSLTQRCDHITPILFNLHWLPVQDRIVFKVLLITYKVLYGMAPLLLI